MNILKAFVRHPNFCFQIVLYCLIYQPFSCYKILSSEREFMFSHKTVQIIKNNNFTRAAEGVYILSLYLLTLQLLQNAFFETSKR